MTYLAALDLVADLVAALKAGGVRATEDPAHLTPPGVLVQVTGLDTLTLSGGLEVATRVVLVSPDTDHHRALESLLELLDKVTAIVDPGGPVTTASIALPNDPAPLPALSFPRTLTT